MLSRRVVCSQDIQSESLTDLHTQTHRTHRTHTAYSTYRLTALTALADHTLSLESDAVKDNPPPTESLDAS